FTGPNERVMDVRVQGALVADNFDLVVAAGGVHRAIAREFSAVATGGTGIRIEIKGETYFGALLSGIEVLAANPAGVAAPTVDVDLSIDDGATWTEIANGLSLDHHGNGRL